MNTPLPIHIGRPAISALEAANITCLEDLRKITEKQLADLHGVGPKAIGILKQTLNENKICLLAPKNVKPKLKYKNLEDFMNNLNPEKRAQVDVLRSLILGIEPKLEEHIKWNAPSYVLDGEDRITFNLMNKQGVVKLVFHMGAIRKEDKKGAPILQDESGLIEWSSDIRGMVTFTTIEDINSNLKSLQKIIKDWLSIPSAV